MEGRSPNRCLSALLWCAGAASALLLALAATALLMNAQFHGHYVLAWIPTDVRMDALGILFAILALGFLLGGAMAFAALCALPIVLLALAIVALIRLAHTDQAA
jgi:hypothetical protein